MFVRHYNTLIFTRWRENIDVTYDYDSIITEKSALLGKSIIDEVSKENISCKWVRLSKLNDSSAFK